MQAQEKEEETQKINTQANKMDIRRPAEWLSLGPSSPLASSKPKQLLAASASSSSVSAEALREAAKVGLGKGFVIKSLKIALLAALLVLYNRLVVFQIDQVSFGAVEHHPRSAEMKLKSVPFFFSLSLSLFLTPQRLAASSHQLELENGHLRQIMQSMARGRTNVTELVRRKRALEARAEAGWSAGASGGGPADGAEEEGRGAAGGDLDELEREREQEKEEQAEEAELEADLAGGERAPNSDWLLDYLTGGGHLERPPRQKQRPRQGQKQRHESAQCLCPPGEFPAHCRCLVPPPLHNSSEGQKLTNSLSSSLSGPPGPAGPPGPPGPQVSKGAPSEVAAESTRLPALIASEIFSLEKKFQGPAGERGAGGPPIEISYPVERDQAAPASGSKKVCTQDRRRVSWSAH